MVIQDGGANSYYTEHKVIHVNNDAGIEQNNKVYIPLHGGKVLIDLKVRSINPSGQVTIFRKENLKELKNVDGYGNYKIFAIEGLVKGGGYEYIYTLKENARSFGREVFQDDIPVIKSNFDLIFPSRLDFVAKCYNGLAKPKYYELDKRRKIVNVYAENIPALIKEEYSSYRNNLMRVDYKLESNGLAKDMNSWTLISNNILKTIHENKASAKIDKLIDALKLEKTGEREVILKVEEYIKSNFTIKEGNNPAYEDLKDIMVSHVASSKGIVKLYLNIWTKLNIQSEMVLTCDRVKGAIDEDFSTYMDLNDILFYFPKHDAYLVPQTSYMRLGAAPNDVAETNGLFISYFYEYGSPLYDTYSIKEIKALDYSHNKTGVKANISFAEGLESPIIEQSNYNQGYRAADYRGYYFFMTDDRRKEFLKTISLSAIDNYTLISRSVEGENVNLSSDADSYFTIKTKYKAPSLIEKAGNDYLLAVGKVIGKQSELYHERERMTDVTFHSISNYIHQIEIEIPAGYKCSGLEGFKINKSVRLTGSPQPVMQFLSDYTVEKNKVIITVNEFYKVLNLPKDKYQDFRQVVNSAADFNKLVLVLEPIVNN